MFPSINQNSQIDDVLDTRSKDLVLLSNVPRYLYPYASELLGRTINKSVHVYRFKDFETFLMYSKVDLGSSEDQFMITKGSSFEAESFTNLGYSRVNRVWEPGEFSLYGDVIVLWEEGHSNPLRISLFGEEIESIDIVDATSRKKIGERNQVLIKKVYLKRENKDSDAIVSEFVVGNEFSVEESEVKFIYTDETSGIEIDDNGYEYLDLGLRSIPVPDSQILDTGLLVSILEGYLKQGYKLRFVGKTLTEFNDLDSSLRNIMNFVDGRDHSNLLSKGFISKYSKEVFITDYEVNGTLNLADVGITGAGLGVQTAMRDDTLMKQDLFKKIKPKDYVVHEDHGVGLYVGIVEKMLRSYMEIQYAGKDRLFIPLSQAKKVTRYVGGGKSKPVLTTLSGGSWQRIKTKAIENAEKLAKELLQLYAMRKIARSNEDLTEGIDRDEIAKFVDSFKFTDTEDQTVSTEQIINDLKSEIPMDRLVVGDVGFGKTEVATRAIFAVANGGSQVALLAPTTILVEQHLAVLRDRLQDYPFRIEALSRFLSVQEKRLIIEDLSNGNIDIIVGTHSLLSDDIKFKKLGLIVIDEEQKFGVEQKEKLKRHRLESHILSLTATPIPRTLNMSMSGLKDISMIATPPQGRKPIKNLFAPFNWDLIKDALTSELDRGGQAYFLHNRVKSIQHPRDELQKMFPDKVIEVAHGQMATGELSYVMGEFSKGAIDILVCTTIIENGIDLANVNTLIVNDSNLFGLSQLYQIRGRIGRSDRQSFAYFFYKSLTGDAGARLEALSDSEDLGAGFMLANRDLEIRGAGNLLGKSQSGSILSIGYGMYMNLLEQKVKELRV